MKKENRSHIMYLEDMNLAMERIAEYILDYSFVDFKQDYKTVDAVIRNFEVIGEASKNLPNKIKERYMIYLGLKCIYCGIRFPMNNLELIMKSFGMLPKIICQKTKYD